MPPATFTLAPSRVASRRARARLRSVPLTLMSSTTEITIHGGQRHHVQGDIRDVERLILGAARGSIMEFAWFTEVQTGESVAINPDSVATLRAGRDAD